MTEAIVTLSSRGLVYIPSKMLKRMGLKSGSRVKLTLEDEKISIKKSPSFSELAGKLKPLAKKYQNIDLREEMEKEYQRI